MLEEFVDKLIEEITSISELHLMQSNLLKYYSVQASLFANAMSEVNKKIDTYDFQSTEEEINFFKNTKPKLIAEEHYSYSRVRCLHNCQNLSKEAKEKFVKRELQRIDNFFLEHKEFCSYLSVGNNHLDENYFTRLSNNSTPTLDYNLSDKNSRTTSKKGYIIGKIISKKRLSVYFQSLLEKDSANRLTDNSYSTKKLNWNGTQTDLVELIYALKVSGCINDSLSNITEVTRQIFGLEPIDTYKTWSRIKSRKKNATPLLTRLLESLTQRIKEENEE